MRKRESDRNIYVTITSVLLGVVGEIWSADYFVTHLAL